MIHIPLKDYQFSGIIAIIGLIMLVTNTDPRSSVFAMIAFFIGVIFLGFGTLVTVLLVFLEGHVSFKK